MSKHDEELELVSSNPAEVHGITAGLGAWATLAGIDGFVQWITSFVDLPPWAVVVRDLLLIGGDVAIGELLFRSMLTGKEGKSVDWWIRGGYSLAAAQTLAGSIIQLYVMYRRKHPVGPDLAKPEAIKARLEEIKPVLEQYQAEYKLLTEAQAKQQPAAGAAKPPAQAMAGYNSEQGLTSEQLIQRQRVLRGQINRRGIIA